MTATRLKRSRTETFRRIWRAAQELAGETAGFDIVPANSAAREIPHFAEPWYCCAEPTRDQFVAMASEGAARSVARYVRLKLNRLADSPQHEPPFLLLLASKLGYQTRSFAEAARRLGAEVILGSDRCHQLDDPWADGAIPLHFEEPQRRPSGWRKLCGLARAEKAEERFWRSATARP